MPRRYLRLSDAQAVNPKSTPESARDDITDALYSGVKRVHRHLSSRDTVYVGAAGKHSTVDVLIRLGEALLITHFRAV